MSRGLTRLMQRLASLHQQRPLLADLIIAVVAVPILLGPRFGDLRETTLAHVFNVLLVLPLLARRRQPVAVFAVISLVALAQWLANERAVGDGALLVAVYTISVSQPTRIAIAAFTVVEVGVVMAALRWGGGGNDELHALVGLTGLNVAAAVVGTNARSRRALVASLSERAERLERERDQQGRLSAAAERARIAREMHDIVAHNVSVMIALADGASYAAPADPDRAASAMAAVSRTGRNALMEMRRLLGVLRDDDAASDRAPQPGLHQIEALVEQIRAAGIPVRYEVSGTALAPVSAGRELAVYRIVQEALTNTIKHAGPGATAQLRVTHVGGEIDVEVVDSGRGERLQEAAAAGTGAGLRGMFERAAVYDGALAAGPQPDGSWRVHLRMPATESLVGA